MQLWEKILQLALLGSERSHLDPVVVESLRQYRVDPEDPLPQVILSGAATLHQIRRLNIQTQPYQHVLPEPAREEEIYHDLPPISLQHLNQILNGKFRPALSEFVQLLVKRRFLLPPESLPGLLDDCLQDPELWQDIQPLLGQRADWLIVQHPQWRALKPQGDVARWSEAGFEERKLIISFVRTTDPSRALQLLKDIWENIGYRKKLGYLDLLENTLNPEDELFLEEALTDSRKEVRLKAADLLARLPDSQLVLRVFRELLPYVTFEKQKQRLHLALPEEIPGSTAKDGIHPGVKKGKKGGLKVDWLFECICRIPVSKWTEQFGWSVSEVIRYFDSANRADLLLSALAESAMRFRDRDLATQLIRYLVLKNGGIPEEMDWKPVVRMISPDDFQNMLEDYFDRQPGLLEEKNLATRMLEMGKHPWSATLSRQVINGLKQWMTESKTFLWNLWHYKRLLETAGYCSPVNLLDELAADWPMHSPVWNQWAPDVERMLRILRFRMEMRAQLMI